MERLSHRRERVAHWRNVSGRRSRQLLRYLDHTTAVHAFAADLVTQSRLLGWEPAQLDPPVRAARHFRHRGGLRSVHPDAFGVLRRGSTTWPFFLEWERRAVRPSTMAARLAPYLRYYSSPQPTDEHGAPPAVLIVLTRRVGGNPLPAGRERGNGPCRGRGPPAGIPQGRYSNA